MTNPDGGGAPPEAEVQVEVKEEEVVEETITVSFKDQVSDGVALVLNARERVKTAKEGVIAAKQGVVDAEAMVAAAQAGVTTAQEAVAAAEAEVVTAEAAEQTAGQAVLSIFKSEYGEPPAGGISGS